MTIEDVTETVEKQLPETGEKKEEKQEVQAPETIESLKARLAEAERKAQNKAEEAERHYKKLAKFEAEETKRKEAEMTELQKAQAKAEEAERRAAKLEHEKLQNAAAVKVGIPAIFADRLKGETPEEMEADAQSILESIPKTNSKSSPGPVNNPGANGKQGETDAERRKRLFG